MKPTLRDRVELLEKKQQYIADTYHTYMVFLLTYVSMAIICALANWNNDTFCSGKMAVIIVGIGIALASGWALFIRRV